MQEEKLRNEKRKQKNRHTKTEGKQNETREGSECHGIQFGRPCQLPSRISTPCEAHCACYIDCRALIVPVNVY
jgi:hypothetical protein